MCAHTASTSFTRFQSGLSCLPTWMQPRSLMWHKWTHIKQLISGILETCEMFWQQWWVIPLFGRWRQFAVGRNQAEAFAQSLQSQVLNSPCRKIPPSLRLSMEKWCFAPPELVCTTDEHVFHTSNKTKIFMRGRHESNAARLFFKTKPRWITVSSEEKDKLHFPLLWMKTPDCCHSNVLYFLCLHFKNTVHFGPHIVLETLEPHCSCHEPLQINQHQP